MNWGSPFEKNFKESEDGQLAFWSHSEGGALLNGGPACVSAQVVHLWSQVNEGHGALLPSSPFPSTFSAASTKPFVLLSSQLVSFIHLCVCVF